MMIIIPRTHDEESQTAKNLKNMSAQEVVDGMSQIMSTYAANKYGGHAADSAAMPAEAEGPRPADWPFMEACEEKLSKMPETWKPYPDDVPGRMSIVSMEYEELKAAATKEDKMHELVDLAAACLHLWRRLAHVE